jgi:antitoxin ParD1/3/4
MPSSYAIGNHFDQFSKGQIESGRYASASEVVREALRLLEEQQRLREMRLDELRRLVQEGIDSGPGVPADKVFAELRRRIDEVSRLQAVNDAG